MKVFISWSGETSKSLAGILKEWIEMCIQSVKPFFSDEDIEKGDSWSGKIKKELNETDFGIICLTPENLDKPWIHFEAGALQKLENSKLCVLVADVSFADIKGPLKAFQATKLEKNDMLKLLNSINHAQEKPLNDGVIENIFKATWGDFEKKFKAIFFNGKKENPSKKPNTDLALEEILRLLRSQNEIISNLGEKSQNETNEKVALYRESLSNCFKKIEGIRKVIYAKIENEDPIVPADCDKFIDCFAELAASIGWTAWNEYFSKINFTKYWEVCYECPF